MFLYVALESQHIQISLNLFPLLVSLQTHLVISQSLDVVQSSAYCLASTIGARHTLDPLIADTSQTNPDSQSASRRHNSPNLRPYANKQLPFTVK